MCRLIACRANNAGNAFLIDAQKFVRGPSGSIAIQRNLQAASVLFLNRWH